MWPLRVLWFVVSLGQRLLLSVRLPAKCRSCERDFDPETTADACQFDNGTWACSEPCWEAVATALDDGETA